MPKKSVAVSLRKPQAPVDIEAFVEGQTAAAVVPAAPANPVQGSAELQHGGRSYREITLHLPTEIARELSFHCMERSRDVNQFVAEAVSKHLANAPAEQAGSNARNIWGGTFEILIEQSRLKLSTLWALRRWGTRIG